MDILILLMYQIISSAPKVNGNLLHPMFDGYQLSHSLVDIIDSLLPTKLQSVVDEKAFRTRYVR